MKLRYALILLSIFSTVVLFAEPIKFRSGYVLAAELSTAKISVSGVHRDAPLNIPSNPVYAVVSVKLDTGRAISIFDYTLDAFGHEIPCSAIRTDKKFIFTPDTVTSKDVIQLLFITSTSYVGKLASEELTLKSKCPPDKAMFSTAIPFTMLNSKAVSAISAVPAAGTFNLTVEKK